VKRSLPIKKVTKTVSVPNRAAGNLTEKEVNPFQRNEDRPISQKKRGGLSAYTLPLKCIKIQSSL